MTTPGDPVSELIDAVRAAREAVADTGFPLPLPSAGSARAERAALLAQIDDYALPRLARLDAPLLVVVGGSTGAGKSTLVNSLVQAPVSPTGVLRPTTRTPVLACHPADAAWFRGGGRGSGMPAGRPAGGAVPARGPLAGVAGLAPIAAPAIPSGLALLDVPDIDSVEAANRTLAVQLLAAADLWLFVTTGNRYADAVPWELLCTARDRGTVVALVLARVPEAVPSGPTVDLVAHLSELLAHNGLGGAPVFVVPQTRVDGQGLLPEPVISPLRRWVDRLAADAFARVTVARCTLDGALGALRGRLEALAAAADEQAATAEALAEAVGLAYGGARAVVERGLRDAAPGAAGLPRKPRRGSGGRAADRERRAAWQANLVALVRSAADAAAEQAGQALGQTGRSLGQVPDATSPGLAGKVARLAHGWDGESAQDLVAKVGELLDAEAARWLDGLAGVRPGPGSGRRLRRAAAALERARTAAALGVAPVPQPSPEQPERADPPAAPPPEPAAGPPPRPRPATSGTPIIQLHQAGR